MAARKAQLLVIVLASFFVISAYAGNNHNSSIIKFKDSESLHKARTSSGFFQRLQVHDEIPQLDMLVVNLSEDELSEKIMAHPLVEYVEPNRVIRLDLPSAPGVLRDEDRGLWGMEAIRANKAWKLEKGSRQTVVAISDTGIYGEHNDLQDNLWQNPGETGQDAKGRNKATNGIDDDNNGFVDDVIGWNFETDSSKPTDFHFHGTHVAGTVGAVGGNSGIVGVSWNISLMITKFLGHHGGGTTEDAIQAIVYAADNGARVMNCSWGGDGVSQAVYDAIEYAKTKGMLIVAAAGNSAHNTDKKPHTPSSLDNDNIIAVAAMDNVDDMPSYFSNLGAQTVDLAAPGSDILSTFNPRWRSGLRKQYMKLSGTSMAAPHVTGLLGLMFSARPDLTWYEAKKIIMDSVRKSPQWKGLTLSGGILDAGRALEMTLK